MKGLSILIPVFNTNVTQLVRDLHQQALALDCPFEIILADDCSSCFTSENSSLSALEGVSYLPSSQNVGRAIIRNRLAQLAKFERLVFMDCDVAMVDGLYLQRYLQCGAADVVFGGYTYMPQQKQRNCMLRWTYDTKLRTLNAEQRSLSPFSSFSTVNFSIKRQLMLDFPFNEKLSAYGHEDSMLRCELQMAGFQIKHIDNPVFHMHLDDNDSYILKTNKGVENLLVINDMPECRPLTDHTNLLRYYNKLQKLHLVTPFKWQFQATKPLLLLNLKSSHPILALYQWYKLGLLCSLKG